MNFGGGNAGADEESESGSAWPARCCVCGGNKAWYNEEATCGRCYKAGRAAAAAAAAETAEAEQQRQAGDTTTKGSEAGVEHLTAEDARKPRAHAAQADAMAPAETMEPEATGAAVTGAAKKKEEKEEDECWERPPD